MGVGIATAISNKEKVYYVNGIKYTEKAKNGSSWGLVGIGAGIVGIGIPFALASNKNAKKAIATENGEEIANFQPYFKIESAGSGVAVSYNF